MSLQASWVVWRATHALRRANRDRRRQLAAELADYRSDADRLDLEATLDRYPDGATAEIRDILAHQRLWGRSGGSGFAGPGLAPSR